MYRSRKQERVAPPAPWLAQNRCLCGKSGCCHDKKGDLKKGEAPPAVHEVVRSAGQPLEAETRAYLEPRFGQDFSHIRVHRDAAAAHSARAVDAQAFAQGNHLVFGSGQYDPKTDSGKKLLAHEIAHSLQQQKGSHGSEHAAERDAEHAAKKAARIDGGDAPIQINEPSGEKRIQRQPLPNQNQNAGGAPPKDEGREKIVNAAQKTTGDPGQRATTLVNLIVTRFYPEYVSKVSGVAFDVKEPGVRVDIKEASVGGKKTQSATVIVGKNFIDGISDDTLRDRIEQLSLGFSHLIPDKDPAQPSAGIIWKIVQDKFPQKAMRIGSTLYDANLPMLLTEFKAGSVEAAGTKKSWGVPRMFYGKAFAALPAGDQEARVHEELDKIDKWKVETGNLTADDLKDSDITSRIRGLRNTALVDLKDKVKAKTKDAKVDEYVDSLMSVSTPLEEGLQRQMDGTLTTMVNGVAITVELDTVGNIKGGETGGARMMSFDPPNVPGYDFDRHNIVSKFDGYNPTITMHIQTTYETMGTRDFTQGYGRGTTQREKELGATSLRYHEGGHGLDFIRFVKANAPPPFTGQVGDTRVAFEQKKKDYVAARARYQADLTRFKNEQGECQGVSMDDYRKTPVKDRVCPPPSKGATP
jgi:hypothetical protein